MRQTYQTHQGRASRGSFKTRSSHLVETMLKNLYHYYYSIDCLIWSGCLSTVFYTAPLWPMPLPVPFNQSGGYRAWSSMVSMLLFLLLSAYGVGKKRREVMRNLYDIQNIRESSDYIEFSERGVIWYPKWSDHFQKRLARIDQLMRLKTQWLVMSAFIAFDTLACSITLLADYSSISI